VTDSTNDLKVGLLFGIIAEACCAIEIVLEYVVLPVNNVIWGKLEFDTVYFLYTLAAFVAARRTGNFRAGISAAFWSAMIASSSYWRRQLLIPLPKKPAIRLTVSD
jgi:hypothetical protein